MYLTMVYFRGILANHLKGVFTISANKYNISDVTGSLADYPKDSDPPKIESGSLFRPR